MKKWEFKTAGTCSRSIIIEVEDDTIIDVQFVGGCRGNVTGLAALVKGRKVSEVIDVLSGIQCQNGTSCPDQLARALRAEFSNKCTPA